MLHPEEACQRSLYCKCQCHHYFSRKCWTTVRKITTLHRIRVQTDLDTDTELLPIYCGPNRAPILFVDRCQSRQDAWRSLAVIWGGATDPNCKTIDFTCTLYIWMEITKLDVVALNYHLRREWVSYSLPSTEAVFARWWRWHGHESTAHLATTLMFLWSLDSEHARFTRQYFVFKLHRCSGRWREDSGNVFDFQKSTTAVSVAADCCRRLHAWSEYSYHDTMFQFDTVKCNTMTERSQDWQIPFIHSNVIWWAQIVHCARISNNTTYKVGDLQFLLVQSYS